MRVYLIWKVGRLRWRSHYCWIHPH